LHLGVDIIGWVWHYNGIANHLERKKMTKFTIDNLYIHSGDNCSYITYYEPCEHGCREKFVARLKYGATSSAKSMVRFLINNFTVEEYFDRITNNEMPNDILRSKGYLLLHIRQWLKRDGYPQNVEGYQAWRRKRRAVMHGDVLKIGEVA
tara:strand:- start:24 stop:473 length:450 start_codon:yes stop_codon:yes gene_type:complete